MISSLTEVFPEVTYGRRTARFYRNVLAKVPKSRRPKVAAMPEAARAMESGEAPEAKALAVAGEPGSTRFGEAAKVVRKGCAETLIHSRFPSARWRRVPASDAIERLSREIRGCTRVVGALPDGGFVLMLARRREAQVRRGGRVGLVVLPGRDGAGRGAVPDGGPLGLSESAQDT